MTDVRTILIQQIDEAERGEWEGKENYDALSPDETVLADNLLATYDEVGPLDESDDIWVTYTAGADNEDASIGVKCANCSFYKNSEQCTILSLAIDPDGICRFSVIPPSKVNVDG